MPENFDSEKRDESSATSEDNQETTQQSEPSTELSPLNTDPKERQAAKFLKLNKKLVAVALTLSSVVASLSPILFGVVTTTIEAGIPYVMYRDDPNKRHLIVEGVESSMRAWPEQAQEILIPLFDRIDEGKEVGTNFIGPLVAATYGQEIDTASIINEWQLWDEAESLANNLGEEFQQQLQIITAESQAFQKLTDMSVSFEERLNLLPIPTQLKTTFPDLEVLRLDKEFSRLVFFKVHQTAFPTLTSEQLQLNFDHNRYAITEDPTLPLDQVREFYGVVVEGVFPNLQFEKYWKVFEQVVEDKNILYFEISKNRMKSDSESTLAAIEQFGVTNPALIWTLTDESKYFLQFLTGGFESATFYENAYGVSQDDLQHIINRLANFTSNNTEFSQQVAEAQSFILQLRTEFNLGQEFNEAETSSNTEPLSQPESTQLLEPVSAEGLITEFNTRYPERQLNPEQYLPWAQEAIRTSPENSREMFLALISLRDGQCYLIDELGATATDLRWPMEESTQFYDDLFTTFPDVPKLGLIENSQYAMWMQVRNGSHDKDSIEHTTLVSLMAGEDTLTEVYKLDNKIVAHQLAHQALEPIFLQHVLVEPADLASHIEGLRTVEADSFTGVYGEINLQTVSLTPEVFFNTSALDENQMAVVIAWSYFLGDNPAEDGGIINPALQLTPEGQLEPVSTATGEGDLNNPANANKKMWAVTTDGQVLEQPWSDFGSTDAEIRANLQTAGATTAFTPNYLYDSSLEVPLASMGMLEDHRNTFLAVYEDDKGNERAGVLVLKPKGGFDNQEIVTVAKNQESEGFKLRSILWGDPGYSVYFDQDGQAGTLIGLNERETHRLVFTVE